MLFPLSTDRPLHRPTVTTFLLIAANVAVFVVQQYLSTQDPEQFERFMRAGQVWGRDFHWWTLVTSVFMHGGVWHIAGNMLFLWVFGPNIEDRLGRVWFLLFYLAGGAAASGLHAAFSAYPAVGASGAIAAVTGAYLVMFPRTIIKCFYVIGLGIRYLPAWWFIGLAVVWDLLMQFGGRFGGMADSIAHLAHLGGYAFGMATAFVLLWLKVVPREQWDLFTQGRQMMRRRAIRSAATAQSREMAAHWENAKKGGGAGGGDGRPSNADRLAHARAEIVRLICAAEFAGECGAARAYRKLIDEFGAQPSGGVGATTLSRRHQLELGHWFYQQHDVEGAVYAYERFLEAYPKDSEAGQVRLLLGMIHARSLNDPVKAKQLIAQAVGELRDDAAIEMAKKELAALG